MYELWKKKQQILWKPYWEHEEIFKILFKLIFIDITHML